MKYFVITILIGVLIIIGFYSNGITGAVTYKEPVHEHISLEEFEKLLEQDKDVVLLDIRTLEEYSNGIIKGAENIDFYSTQFRQNLNFLDKTKTYLIYCRTGSRTSEAINIMENLGFIEVYGLEGGILNWASQGKTITTP